MVADYNGWADLPEAEREALDLLELSPVVPSERRSHVPSARVLGVVGIPTLHLALAVARGIQTRGAGSRPLGLVTEL
jgi:hypothetical protein